jgi:hypothetical protein
MERRAGRADRYPLRHGRLSLFVMAVALFAAAPATTVASGAPDPNGFQIQVPPGGWTVHENAGQAVITVVRDPSASRAGAQVRYITSGNGYNPDTNAPFDCGGTPCSATPYDFTSVKGQLDFAPGQSTATFAVPIVDHGTTTVPKTFRVSLFGASPIGLGPTASAPLTILNDDPVTPPTPGNPLGLAVAPTGGNPLAGARFLSIRTVRPRTPPGATVICGRSRRSPERRGLGPSATARRTSTTSEPRCRVTSSGPRPRGQGRSRCSRPTGSSTGPAETATRPPSSRPTTTS